MSLQHRCLMTWEKSKLRWRKMSEGKVYTVSCVSLGVPGTKEESYQAANQWWRERLAALTKVEPAHQEEIRRLEARKQWAMRHDEPGLSSTLDPEIERLRQSAGHEEIPDIDESRVQEGIRTAELFGIGVPEDIDYDVANHYFGDKGRWQGRLESDRNNPKVPQDESLGFQVDQWLHRQSAKVHTKDMTPGRYDNIRRAIHHFRDFAGKNKAINNINEKTVDDFYNHCFGRIVAKVQGNEGGWSTDYSKFVFETSKAFIKACWSRRLLELPRNLDEHKIKVQPKAINPITVDDFKKMVDHAKGQLKLHLLLMLNCGMRSTDLSDLVDHEVDWQEGRIIRQRSKTRIHNAKNVPTVNYRLWDQTFALLKQHRCEGEIVLRTKSGGLWAWEEMVDGKLKSSDNIATNYNRLRSTLKVETPLSGIRKRGASTLDTHEHYGRYANHYLAESPRTIKDKHYAEPSVDLFDAVLKWLGEQFGFETTR